MNDLCTLLGDLHCILADGHHGTCLPDPEPEKLAQGPLTPASVLKTLPDAPAASRYQQAKSIRAETYEEAKATFDGLDKNVDRKRIRKRAGGFFEVVIYTKRPTAKEAR